MDITRNWRLKTSRSQLIATRCPETGAVILAQQNGAAARAVDLYTFEDVDVELAERTKGNGNGHYPEEGDDNEEWKILAEGAARRSVEG